MAATLDPKPCSFKLDTLLLQGLRWGEGNAKKLIALHGWLDNAGSFSLLAPLLAESNDLDIVCLDLAGHGKSGFRPGLFAYNVWQDVLEISLVADQLAWTEFALLGHSRGAMIASIYAGTFPDQITGLCLIDAVTPVTCDEAKLPEQLARSISGLKTVDERRSSYFDSYEDASLARTRGAYPLSPQASKLLAERSVVEEGEAFVWRYDKRLLVASEIRFSQAQAMAFVDAFKVMALVLLAKNGLVHGQNDEWFFQHQKLKIIELDGEHHLQLSEDVQILNQLASLINEYIVSI